MFNCSLHACTMLPQPTGILTYLITTDLLTIINFKGRGLIRNRFYRYDTSTIPDGIEESNTQESESPITKVCS